MPLYLKDSLRDELDTLKHMSTSYAKNTVYFHAFSWHTMASILIEHEWIRKFTKELIVTLQLAITRLVTTSCFLDNYRSC